MKRLIISETEKNNIQKLYESKGILLFEQNTPTNKTTGPVKSNQTGCSDMKSNRTIINDIIVNKRPLNTFYTLPNVGKSVLFIPTPQATTTKGVYSSNISRTIIGDNGNSQLYTGLITLKSTSDTVQPTFTDLSVGFYICGDTNGDVETPKQVSASMDLYFLYSYYNGIVQLTPENYINLIKKANPNAGEALLKTLNPKKENANDPNVKKLYDYIKGLRGQTQQVNPPTPQNQPAPTK
jgi:hypothetical protein